MSDRFLHYRKGIGRRRLGVSLGVFLVAAGVSGCADPANVGAEPFLVIAGPEDLRSFSLRDADGAVIWAIETDHRLEIARLDYGAVPAGFRQTVPAAGSSPRRLVPGEALTAVTATASRVFTHRGFARGAAAWSIHDYQMELINQRLRE